MSNESYESSVPNFCFFLIAIPPTLIVEHSFAGKMP